MTPTAWQRPAHKPAAEDSDAPRLDPLWDAPLQKLPVPAHGQHAEVEAGTAIPDGYVESTAGHTNVDLPLGFVRSRDVPDFVFTAP